MNKLNSFLRKIILDKTSRQDRIAEKRRMTSKELVRTILANNVKSSFQVSEKDAKLVLVDMDFEDVEKNIFGTSHLDSVEFDNGHSSVVPTGYPFMNEVSTLTEKRLGMRGIHAMK